MGVEDRRVRERLLPCLNSYERPSGRQGAISKKSVLLDEESPAGLSACALGPCLGPWVSCYVRRKDDDEGSDPPCWYFFFLRERKDYSLHAAGGNFSRLPKCRSDRCNNGTGAAALEMWDIRFLGYMATGVRGWTIDNFADHN